MFSVVYWDFFKDGEMSKTMLCTVKVSVLVKICFYYTSTLSFLSLQILNNFLKWIAMADPVSFFFFFFFYLYSGGFPGSQPVSMDVQNIKLLHEKPYRVSWKADGVR